MAGAQRTTPRGNRTHISPPRLSDQQPPPEHPLEAAVVAVALDAPARERQVAVRFDMEVDPALAGPQPDRGHRAVPAALEVLGEPQDRRAAGEQLLVSRVRQRRPLPELGGSLAVV